MAKKEKSLTSPVSNSTDSSVYNESDKANTLRNDEDEIDDHFGNTLPPPVRSNTNLKRRYAFQKWHVNTFDSPVEHKGNGRHMAKRKQIADMQTHKDSNLKGLAKNVQDQQMRFQSMSVGARLKWAYNHLFVGDMHFILASPIFLLLGICVLIELCIFSIVKVVASLFEGISFRLHASLNDSTNEDASPRHPIAFIRKWIWCNIRKICQSRPDTQYDISLTKCKKRLVECKSYTEYMETAKSMDELTGRAAWKLKDESRTYDAVATRKRTNAMRDARLNNDIIKVIKELRLSMIGHAMSVFQEPLYSRTYFGTKQCAEAFLQEIKDCFKFLESNGSESKKEILELIQDIRQSWAQTSLVLSGGAMLGLHHFGVLEALLYNNKTGENLLPKVIGGCSAGAAVAAWLCTRTDEELKEELTVDYIDEFFRALSPNNWILRFWNLIRRGYMCDTFSWVHAAQKLFGELTFLEAYKKTGRILNVAMTRADRNDQVQVMNYKNAPNVVIWSAIMCSCAFPFLTLPMPLMEKSKDGRITLSKDFECCYFHDGSLSGDIPINAMRVSWGELYTIVSQVNPHVFPFSGSNSHGEAGMPVQWRGVGGQWRAGFLLSSLELMLKEHLRFLLRLMALLNVSPTLRGINARSLAMQTYTGDITLHPQQLRWKYIWLMNDQVKKDIEWYIQEGRFMAFPKLEIISNRVAIDRCIEQLESAMLRLDT